MQAKNRPDRVQQSWSPSKVSGEIGALFGVKAETAPPAEENPNAIQDDEVDGDSISSKSAQASPSVPPNQKTEKTVWSATESPPGSYH